MVEDELRQEHRRVVVIDDDAAIVEVVSEILADEGFTVTGCTMPEEALALIQRVAPHLVILDLAMPGVDGFELLRQLRAAPETAALPVLVVTASVAEIAERLPPAARRDVEVLRKPFDLDALLEAVERMLEA